MAVRLLYAVIFAAMLSGCTEQPPEIERRGLYFALVPGARLETGMTLEKVLGRLREGGATFEGPRPPNPLDPDIASQPEVVTVVRLGSRPTKGFCGESREEFLYFDKYNRLVSAATLAIPPCVE